MKTLIIGFDAFDPVIFEKLNSEGKTPNLNHFVELGGYSRFSVTSPPQSEVSWTSIATGLNPGGHGIFDFVHRNPESYVPQVSLLPTKTNILGRQFVHPHQAPTIFEAAVDAGYPGISLWWPATFPARLESPVWSIPGLGTPDIFGRLGVGISYSMDGSSDPNKKTRFEQLKRIRKGHYQGNLEGPVKMSFSGMKETQALFELKTNGNQSCQFLIGRKTYELQLGEWSPFIELTFKVGFGISVKAITRAIVSSIDPDPILYFLPLQIHPLHSPWAYGTPKRLMKEVWNNPGPYLTLGWPQDTTGLEEGMISNDQFLKLCDQIFIHREHTLFNLLDTYQEGVLACIFDSLDRIQHMFFRDRKDIIEAWYIRLDALLGRITKKIQAKENGNLVNIIVVSDHGFGEFNYKVDLNRWLLNHGYLVAESETIKGNLRQIDWKHSQSYAVGLNSLYLNLLDREGQGFVSPESKPDVIHAIQTDLLNWKGPDGKNVVHRLQSQENVFQGPYTKFGPDFVVGYNPGYRASAQTGLGDWDQEEIVSNQDHWGADHCFDADTVPGVLFSSRGLKDFSTPSFEDFPGLAIDMELLPNQKEVSLPVYSDEDREKVEERLKELGYL